MPTHFKKP